jgi:hypothetical protein
VVYVIGGYHVFANGNEISSNKVHRLDVNTNTFISDGAPIPFAIDDQVQAVWRDSLIYVVTGWSNTASVAKVQIYNASANTWSAANDLPATNFYNVFGASGAIVDDTIYYFGGASMGTSFPAVNILRKGIINPANPTQVTWSYQTVPNAFAYRSGAIVVGDYVCWIGGSATTYNFDGIAYNRTGGVKNLKQAIWYNYKTGNIIIDTSNDFNMDLRGVASSHDGMEYLIGGMQANQAVSNSCKQLNFNNTSLQISNVEKELACIVSPNPVNNILRLSCKQAIQEVNIYDNAGRMIKNTKAKNIKTIDLNTLPKGNYFVQLKINGIQLLKPIIKN